MAVGRFAAAVALAAASAQATRPGPTVAERAAKLTRDSVWTLVAAIPIGFRTFHPQGMVKIGGTIFVSSVEVTRPTTRFARPVGGHDRDAGEGAGHLFKIDGGGRLVADVRLGEGSIYHPGGLDYDGQYIWVAVAEYRPDSRSIVYRVDPATLKATEVLRFADHLGAIVHNTDDGTLHGISWGSRRFYRWTLGSSGRATSPDARPSTPGTANPSHYIDYQDCKYVGGRRMLCTGVAEIHRELGSAPFRLGGIELVDLADGRPLHQAPVLLWTAGGLDMTHNPVWVEPSDAGLRAYFMPEDDASTLYVFDVNAR